MNKFKLQNLGVLGILGILGFFIRTKFDLTSLFNLFFLFFLGALPKGTKSLLYFAFIILLTVGGIFNNSFIHWLITGFFIIVAFYWLISYFQPINRGKLNQKTLRFLKNPNIPIKEGIGICIDQAELTGQNKHYQEMYDKIAPFYDLFQTIIYFFWGGENKCRMDCLDTLEIKENDNVLEVSVGTGGNIHCLKRDAHYYGLDISWGMLKQCQKNLSRWKRDANLFWGKAEVLPFKDNTFDVVFHVGGINFFNDKKKAIEEMIRVAKPGARILIADETAQIAQKTECIPGVNGFYNQSKELYQAPLDLVPKNVTNLHVKTVFENNLFCLTFNKPLNQSTL